jgi:predicted transcriptional regulator
MASTTSLKLPDDLKEKVGDLATVAAQTPHAYMVDAIAERVARDEKRRAFLQAAERSLANLRKTGVAYRFEDVAAHYLARAQGRKTRRPKAIKLKTHRS